VALERCVLPCKNEQIYAPYLISKSKPYLYQGYEDISQIGKYYAVTIQGRKTRLYTLVNFIHPPIYRPLVRQRTLTERWKFCIYIAVEYTDEIHDLTASQLNHLSRSRVMEVFFTDPPISASYILIYRLSIKDFNITLPSWLPK
jgi:hypothetical protein